jgi:SAM-dependent methyltransferase
LRNLLWCWPIEEPDVAEIHRLSCGLAGVAALAAWARSSRASRAGKQEVLYATPIKVTRAADCFFYHVMDIPGHGLTTGLWDLRQGVDDCLGRMNYSGKRVLEIGPASGFLTFEMEKRGAQVVAVELLDDPGWDFVPYPEPLLRPILEPRRKHHMRLLKNSFWFAHAAHKSEAKLYYGDAYHLPDALGQFDIAIMAAVLLHCRNPLQIVEQCARRAKTLVIVDALAKDLEGKPVCWLVPTADNFDWDTWWRFSTDFFVQFCQVLGHSRTNVFSHSKCCVPPSRHDPQPQSPELFTVVASKA